MTLTIYFEDFLNCREDCELYNSNIGNRDLSFCVFFLYNMWNRDRMNISKKVSKLKMF